MEGAVGNRESGVGWLERVIDGAESLKRQKDDGG